MDRMSCKIVILADRMVCTLCTYYCTCINTRGVDSLVKKDNCKRRRFKISSKNVYDTYTQVFSRMNDVYVLRMDMCVFYTYKSKFSNRATPIPYL